MLDPIQERLVTFLGTDWKWTVLRLTKACHDLFWVSKNPYFVLKHSPPSYQASTLSYLCDQVGRLLSYLAIC